MNDIHPPIARMALDHIKQASMDYYPPDWPEGTEPLSIDTEWLASHLLDVASHADALVDRLALALANSDPMQKRICDISESGIEFSCRYCKSESCYKSELSHTPDCVYVWATEHVAKQKEST